MRDLVVKTIFFSSPEETNLEIFMGEFLDVCTKYDLNFREISSLFEKILSMPPDNMPDFDEL